MAKSTYDTHGKVIFWKNIFCSTKVTKSGEKEFLKLYIVLLQAKLRCTIKSSLMGQTAGDS